MSRECIFSGYFYRGGLIRILCRAKSKAFLWVPFLLELELGRSILGVMRLCLIKLNCGENNNRIVYRVYYHIDNIIMIKQIALKIALH